MSAPSPSSDPQDSPEQLDAGWDDGDEAGEAAVAPGNATPTVRPPGAGPVTAGEDAGAGEDRITLPEADPLRFDRPEVSDADVDDPGRATMLDADPLRYDPGAGR